MPVVRGAERKKDEVSVSSVFSLGVILSCSIRAIFSSWGILLAISTSIKEFKSKPNRVENVIYWV